MIYTIEEYNRLTRNKYQSYLNDLSSSENIIKCGMLEWDKDSAWRWSGPFPLDTVFFKIRDYRIKTKYDKPLKNESDLLIYIENNIKKYNYITNKEFYLKENLALTPTIENPIKFYICGNDDCSYTVVFPNVRSALNALEYIEELPLFEVLFDEYGFMFSN